MTNTVITITKTTIVFINKNKNKTITKTNIVIINKDSNDNNKINYSNN